MTFPWPYHKITWPLKNSMTFPWPCPFLVEIPSQGYFTRSGYVLTENFKIPENPWLFHDRGNPAYTCTPRFKAESLLYWTCESRGTQESKLGGAQVLKSWTLSSSTFKPPSKIMHFLTALPIDPNEWEKKSSCSKPCMILVFGPVSSFFAGLNCDHSDQKEPSSIFFLILVMQLGYKC